MSRRSGTQPEIQHYSVPVRAAAPQAIALARGLARAFTQPSLRGTGAVRYGYPGIGMREKFGGYANSPQLFLGYSPHKVAAGAFRGAPGALPSTSSPTSLLNNTLLRAVATITEQQQQLRN